jgi:hypothetical protein
MGYVNDTQMRQFIPPFMCGKSAGTWTPTLASNVVGDVRTAADASFTLMIPITVPSNAAALKGAYLTAIDVWYKIATAAADDFATVELEKMTLPASGTAVSGAAVTVTMDTGHDTAAERKAAGDAHKMTVTLSTPVWVDEDDVYYLCLTVDAAATTAFTFYGARANFTLRV